MKIRQKFLFVILCFLIVVYVLYVVLFTSSGASFTLNHILPHLINADIHIKKVKGNLANQLFLYDLEINRWKKLTGANVHISEVKIKSLLSKKNILLNVTDGTLFLSPKNVIVFNGTYHHENIDFKIFGKAISLSELRELYPIKSLKDINGKITNFSQTIKGPLNKLNCKGEFTCNNVSYHHTLLQQTLCSFDIALKVKEKNVSGKLKLSDIVLLENPSSKLKTTVQNITISFSDYGFKNNVLKHSDLSILNGLLHLPISDVILFSGTKEKNKLDFNMYSDTLDIAECLHFFPSNPTLKKVTGRLSKADIFITGSVLHPKIDGKFKIDELYYPRFYVKNCSCEFSIMFKKFSPLAIVGEARFANGIITGPKTAVISLEPSDIKFIGSINNPILHITGKTQIEKVAINLNLQGTLKKPIIKATSEPNLPQDQLLLMVSTGMRWKSIEQTTPQKEIPVDLIKDFVDYFLFGNAENKLSQYFGVDYVSLKYDKNKTGIEVKKDILDNLRGSYAIEQDREKDQPVITQKVEGEYQINNDISVTAEEEFKKNKESIQNDKVEKNEKIMVKYKKKF